MSLSIDNIIAYNVKLKEKEPMKVVAVVKTPIMKEGQRTGKFRYRLAGVGSDGTGMSRFVNKEDAEKLAKQLGKNIEEREAKPSSRRKTCKKIGEDAESRCKIRRAAKRAADEEKKPVTKTKKSSSTKKKTPVKRKTASKRGRSKKR